MDESSDQPPARVSTTPSWVMLGFVLGALFVWALPRAAGPSADAPRPPRTVVLERPKASDIEAVFTDWGRFAVWDHDLTEVALWDVEKKAYTIFYEIYRNGDALYFRSIPHLTRPLLTHGVPHGSPLQYTETEEQRREWLTGGEPSPGR